MRTGLVYNAHMSITTVQAWHCDVCGYEWIKSDAAPTHCANRSCRSRRWNQGFIEQACQRAPKEAIAVKITSGAVDSPGIVVRICKRCRGPLNVNRCFNSQCVLFRGEQ